VRLPIGPGTHLVAIALTLGVGALQGTPERAYVTAQPPTGLPLARNLTAADRRQNFEDLWQIIDANYADFGLKSIDWPTIGARYRTRLEGIGTDDDFYWLLFQLVNELKDTHSWLQNYRARALVPVASMPVDVFQGKPFVLQGTRAGWEVVAIDGMTPAQRIESLRPQLHACSSERAFLREAGRQLLAGKPDEPAVVILRSPDGRSATETVARGGRSGLSPPRTPVDVTRQRYVQFGRHASGIGYIRIDTFNGREDIDHEFDRALEALRETPGLILDIRDNTGGFGHAEIVGRFLQRRVTTGFSYVKSGPGHSDLRRTELHASPTGAWHYTRPLALLVNDVTGSAADLFATELRSRPQVTTVGTTTHGNLSGVAVYGVLTCGLVVRISNGYISDARDRPVEGAGNVPGVVVEPTIQDYLTGRDPVFERALEILARPSRRERPHAGAPHAERRRTRAIIRGQEGATES
jgi:carboxyl-terminal processing protease